MNRKKGIIIGTTGIIIVTLALIGFTYGFYLSLISGNETSKKVKVTAGKSKLEYVELSTEVDTIIGPGYTNTKYFAVQNVGDISGSYYLYLVDVENTFNRKNDIVYTIYRKAYDYSEENVEPEEFDINGTYDFSLWENVTNSHCKTVSEFTDYGDCQYPSEKSQLSTQKQTIMEKDDYYVYAFVVTYINQPEIDQIADEESVFSGIVKIYADETGTDVSPFEPGTLADGIYTSAKDNKNGTIYSPTPISTPGIEVNGENEATLSVTKDDEGTTFYFRGNVKDNYINFAGMCWRIVRIAGDGSVKIVLEDQDEACSTSMNGNWGIPTTTGGTTYTGNYGYELKNVDSDPSNEYIMSYLKPVTNADKSMARAFYDFQKDKLEDYKSKLKSGNWCLADKAYTQSGSSPNYTYTLLEEYNYSSNMYYDSYVRLYGNSTKEPTLKCTGTIMDKFESVTYNETEIIEEAPMYVSALTADEMVYAGGKVYSTNGNFYLLNDNFKSGNAGYYYFWSLSPSNFSGYYDFAFVVYNDGGLFNYSVSSNIAFRPAVSLASSAVISSGEGTLEKPYVIG